MTAYLRFLNISIESPENFTWLDLIVILTFVVLVGLGIGLPTAKFLLHRRFWYRRVVIDAATHDYDRERGTTLAKQESFQRTAQLTLDEPGAATIVFRVRTSIPQRPRHTPEFSFRHLRFVTFTRGLWRPRHRTFQEADANVIHGDWIGNLTTTPPNWDFIESSNRVDYVNFTKNDRHASDYAYFRHGVRVGEAWSGVLLIDAQFEVEDWRWNFATVTVEKTLRVPVKVSIESPKVPHSECQDGEDPDVPAG